ncbi:hypothetical protein D0Z00_001950 [Geotrichum galactomycetum]|uniref:Uncharacterized protein n=1 Tax=Geotrichum galactomycetum TaxID=27317 RepID=A0ACB6V5J7_9ASCO|nr:hypothetical protein D0Z00_001950 [Geotrichum candidum]
MSLPLKATKAIESFFINATPNTQRLPRDVVELLQAPPSDDAVVGTFSLHEELLKLQQTAKDHNVSTALFLQCLTHLAPRLNNVDHLEQWFKAYVNPAINSAGHKNEDVEASQEFLLSVLTNGVSVELAADNNDSESSSNSRNIADTDDIKTSSQLYFYWIFDLYQGFLSKYFEFMRAESGLALAERKRFIIQNAKDLLIKYGHLHPLEFFKYLAKKAAKPENRLKVLMLASQLVSSTDTRNGSDNSSVVGDVLEMYPNLSVITKTDFPEILFNCLRHDESSTTIQICINALSMFLPYMYKVEDFELDIPRLLVLLGRAACSPKSTVSAVETALKDKDTPQDQQENHSAQTPWTPLNQAFGLPEVRRPDISPLFCVLYGLFPFNVLEFSNNPRGYLTAAKYAEPLPENWDSFQIKRVLKAIFPSYALNPFMTEYNNEQEASEIRRSRLDSVDDVIVHCLSLRVRDDIFPLNAGLNDVEDIENGNILNNMNARLKQTLVKKEEEIKSRELLLKNSTTEHSDQGTDVMAKIKELTQARDFAVYNMREVEVKLRRHINNLQAAIRDYQEKPKAPSGKLLADYNSYMFKDGTRYNELSAAFVDLSEKYNLLNETFTKYVAKDQLQNKASGSNYKSLTPTTPQPQPPKTLLGFDAEETSGTNPSSSASRSMHSISTGSTTAAGATSQLPPGSALPQKKGSVLVTATGGQANANIVGANNPHEQQQQRPRFRGRGGVQGSMRKKETGTSGAQGSRTFKFK